MKIPLIDMVAQYRSVRTEIDDAIRQVLEAGQFILGPNVAALEKEVADYLGTEHAVGVASGTDALILALRSLDIGPGDEVIMPAYTFFATAGAVMLVGATPVFADIEADTYCVDAQQVADRCCGAAVVFHSVFVRETLREGKGEFRVTRLSGVGGHATGTAPVARRG